MKDRDRKYECRKCGKPYTTTNPKDNGLCFMCESKTKENGMKDDFKGLSTGDCVGIVKHELENLAKAAMDLAASLVPDKGNSMTDREKDLFRLAASRHVLKLSEEMAFFVQIGSADDAKTSMTQLKDLIMTTLRDASRE